MSSGYNKPLFNKLVRERKKSHTRAMIGDIAGSLLAQAPYWYNAYRQNERQDRNDEAVRNLTIRHPELGLDPSEAYGMNPGDLAGFLLKSKALDRERAANSFPVNIDGETRMVPFENMDDVGRYLGKGSDGKVMMPLHVQGTELERLFPNADKNGDVVVPEGTFNTALPILQERAGANAAEKARAALLANPDYQREVDDSFLEAAGIQRPPPAPVEPQMPAGEEPGPTWMGSPPSNQSEWENYHRNKEQYDQDMETWQRNQDAFTAKAGPYLGQGRFLDPEQVTARIREMRIARQGDALQRLRELAQSDKVDAQTKGAINAYLASAFMYQGAGGQVNLPPLPDFLTGGRAPAATPNQAMSGATGGGIQLPQALKARFDADPDAEEAFNALDAAGKQKVIDGFLRGAK